MLLHFIGVIMVTLIILFSDDMYFLLAIIISQTLVFTQLVVIDGCIISKYEHMFGDNFNLSDMCKKLFFLSNDVPQADFEKMIVGIPLMLCIFKLGFMLLPKDLSNSIKDKYMTFANLKVPSADIKKAFSSLKLPKI